MRISLSLTGLIENHNGICQPEEFMLTKNALSVDVACACPDSNCRANCRQCEGLLNSAEWGGEDYRLARGADIVHRTGLYLHQRSGKDESESGIFVVMLAALWSMG